MNKLSLQQYEEILRSFNENQTELVVKLTLSGRFTYANSPYCRKFNKTPEELVGNDFISLVHKDDQKATEEALANLFTPPHTFCIEHRALATHGWWWIAWQGILILDEKGEPNAIIVRGRDITESKQIKEALWHSQERFRQISEQTSVWIWEVDKKGLYTYSSSIAEQILGYRPEELVEKKYFYDLFCPDEREKIKGMALQAFENKEYFRDFENINIHKSGKTVILKTNGTPILDEKGNLLGYRGSDTDITLQRQHEQEVDRLNRLYDVLSHVNQALIKTQSHEEFFQQVCRSIVERGGFKLSWIGECTLLNHDAAPAVWASAPQEYIHQITIFSDARLQGFGFAATAISEGNAYICNDFFADPQTEFWHDWAKTAGIQAAAVFPIYLDGSVYGVLTVCASDKNVFREKEVNLLREVASDISFGLQHLKKETQRKQVEKELQERTLELEMNVERLQQAWIQTIEVLASAAEAKDPYTAGHQRRVAQLAVAIGKELLLPEHQITGLRMAALVHDIGKITVPGEILSKPGKLSEVEKQLINTHAAAGYEILKKLDLPWGVANIVKQHHERYDGSGYPEGIKGNDIVLEARILAVADVVEAMYTHRPYRPALGIDIALAEIMEGKGVRYDPDIVDVCVRVFYEKEFSFS